MNKKHHHAEFLDFQKQYALIFENFLKHKEISENFLNEGYQFGRLAVSKELNILSLVAIHHDCLINYLENLASNDYLEITNKASIFLEEVLASYQMVLKDFGDAITLLNKRSVGLAIRIRDIKEALKEKEMLLKEVYHRVKNNLQVISSLLHLQIENTLDLETQLILTESTTRVKSMALVHEMLYQSNNFSKVEMKNYINRLYQYLHEIYKSHFKEIKTTFEMDSVFLNIEKAIPCGLIVNELISNIFKHAFSKNELGEITISLKLQDNQLFLIIKDSGKGIPEHINFEHSSTLGMQLIRNLTRQLNGNITFNNNNGSSFHLEFSAV